MVLRLRQSERRKLTEIKCIREEHKNLMQIMRNVIKRSLRNEVKLKSRIEKVLTRKGINMLIHFKKICSRMCTFEIKLYFLLLNIVFMETQHC